MSEFVWTTCVCGGVIQSAAPNPDDVLIAVSAHNDTARHQEWRAVQALKQPTRRGPCICKGGEAGPAQYRRNRHLGAS